MRNIIILYGYVRGEKVVNTRSTVYYIAGHVILLKINYDNDNIIMKFCIIC